MKYCANCGSQCADNLAFCNSCGAPLQSEPQYQPQYQAQPMYAAPSADLPGKGLGIASMILGIISLVMFCIWYIALPCAVISLIFGFSASSKAKSVGMSNGMATAGIILAFIAVGIALTIAAVGAAFLAELGLL